ISPCCLLGNMCHGVLPLLTRPSAGRTQTFLDVPLLPFLADIGRAVTLAPNDSFSQMDPFHKSLMGSGYRATSPQKRKARACSVFRLRLSSETQIASHYCGPKQAKRLKVPDAGDAKIRTSELATKESTLQSPSPSRFSDGTTSEALASVLETASPSQSHPESFKAPSEIPATLGTRERDTNKEGETDTCPEGETEEERAKRLLYCSLCKVAVNSASQLQAHNSGTKHKTMLEARSGGGAIKSFPRMGVKAKSAAPSETSTGLQNKTFHCEICDVHVNSETQLKQHISSRRHKDRAAGKPAKPKFSPYTSSQRHHSLPSVSALFKNQNLTKPLAPCLIPQFSVAAAMGSLPTFPLHPASSSSHALFQGQPLRQALLRPAPGPIAPSPSQVLFSPY
uniref:Zinc finger protein 385D n=1 Tax=Tetraodon nigroviridis TaxID=99883 RepID=H3CUX5_TETNG